MLLFSVSAATSEEMDAIIDTLVTEQVGFPHLPLLPSSPHTACVSCWVAFYAGGGGPDLSHSQGAGGELSMDGAQY